LIVCITCNNGSDNCLVTIVAFFKKTNTLTSNKLTLFVARIVNALIIQIKAKRNDNKEIFTKKQGAETIISIKNKYEFIISNLFEKTKKEFFASLNIKCKIRRKYVCFISKNYVNQF
jgi:hypothetical protein